MALPTFSAHVPSRSRVLAEQLARQREQEARWRQQWELHAQYFREQSVRSQRQAAWSSRHSYQQSMSAYHKQRLKEEKKASLEQRRNRLRAMLQEEQNRLEAELREVVPDRITLASQLVEKTEELRTAREERRKKLAQELLREHWKKNNQELREVESALHKDHVVGRWQEQISEKKQAEKKRFENEYERTRKEALERMKQAEEQRKAEERKRAEELCQQMEELKLREEEATRLKKEQEALLIQQWELEKMEDERQKVEERRKKSEMGHFLIRQYRAQLRRRAQQVQEELEADRKILAALLEGETDDRRMETARRERAIADAAWMKRVIEEQLQLERQREAEFDILHREEAQRVWEKREAQWEKERKARERLMHEVYLLAQVAVVCVFQAHCFLFCICPHSIRLYAFKNRTDLNVFVDIMQVEQQHQEQWEELCRMEQEEEEDREAQRIQEEELRLEMQRMAKKGYQEKIHSRPRSAWT
uniref:Trichoplein keratin filament-binding protein n=1 Tax=Stegastes partitus TaxID=144197 RepID=A0A3B5AG27_9TELE